MANTTLSNETWDSIPGFRNYMISTVGRVKNASTGSVLAQRIHPDGHCMIKLYKDGKQRTRYVHRLVYESFCGVIPPGYDVHHVDKNPANNSVFNLMLVPHGKHISRHNRGNGHRSVPVCLISPSGDIIKTFPSIVAASEYTGAQKTGIVSCCKGRRKSCGGYLWAYAEEVRP